MKATLRLIPLLAIAALFAGCEGVGTRERLNVTIERRWPAAEIEKIRVSEANGTVSIEAVEGDEISLVARVRGRGKRPDPAAENQALFTSRISGDTLRIGRSDKSTSGFRFLRGDRLRIDYELRVPREVALDLQTVNGRIITRGVDGETEATTVNGSIDIETSGTSELSASAVNGKIRAKFARSFQGADFKTVNGSVYATLPQDASFAVNLSQVNGHFEAAFPLSIRSNPGSRRVSGDVNGGRYELRIVTVNGHVELSQGAAANGTLAPPPAVPATASGPSL